MTIRNLSEANEALVPYVQRTSKVKGKDLRLDGTLALLDLVGNPQDGLRIVHIAGTSGKTSTAYYMAALLHASGKKVGLTISPHIDGVNERVQVDGAPLTEAEFCEELGDFLEIVRRAGQSPSYFELLYAFALWVFARRGVDYVVVETGIGGLHDATNVAKRPDKVCIITDIGFDHMHVLGNTLAEITTQKIGIVHNKNEVFLYEQDREVMQAVHDWTSKHRAAVHMLDEQSQHQTYHQDLLPIAAYQQRNWLLAYAVYRYLAERDRLEHLTRQALHKTQHVQVPGRMDIRHINSKTIVMDGAHNAQKMTACIESFQQLYPGVKPAVLLGLKEGKEYEDLVPLITPFASRIIVTTFDTTQDSQAQSMDPGELAQDFRASGATAVTVIPEQHKALEALLASPGQIGLITGSFYLLSQMRNNEHI